VCMCVCVCVCPGGEYMCLCVYCMNVYICE